MILIIYTAYGTCTVGFWGCFNHVITLLFCVEAAVCTGARKPSPTSVLAKLNVPTGFKSKWIHKPICDMTFNNFSKDKICMANENTCPLNLPAQKKLNYFKIKLIRGLPVSKKPDVSSDSCFMELMEGTRKSQPKKKINSISLKV